ncbi:MAG TPA: lantibiotic dehydratase [Pseudonocardiaceae bacterium]|nr:lantibiotic dehydratase [Pseudonocardiaceae bacterium]
MAPVRHARIPNTDWRVWRWALLRSAGFPADGLDRFAAVDCARAADAVLDAADDEFTAAFARAVADTAKAIHDIAADPRFRMAMTWQNPGALVAVRGVLRDGPDAPRNSRRRGREEIIAKYWQRYCAKNDSIGFFGPLCWVRLDPDGPPMTGGPGEQLTTGHTVFFERWALAAFAERLAADARIRPSLPVGLEPHLSLGPDGVRHPQRGLLPVAPAEAALLAACDGRRSAAEVAATLTSAPEQGFRTEHDVYALVDQLVGRGLLRLGIDLPMDLTAEQVLREHLAAIDDPTAHHDFARLAAARDALAAADADTLADAMATLEAEFTAVTGREPRQKPGETQAGRTLCHLETVRDVDLTFGRAVLDRLTPLAPLLDSARWLTAELAGAYRALFERCYRDALAGEPDLPFEQLWYPAFDALIGAERPADPVIADYLARWRQVLRLDAIPPGTARLDLTTDELAARVSTAFPATAPGWALARIHSPDLHLCAPSAEALARGEFTVVLGELHVGLASLDTNFFTVGHPAPDEMIAAMAEDVPTSRVALATPYHWPRTTAREAEWLTGPDDAQLGFAPAPGVRRDRLLPITSLRVADTETGLVVRAPDGRSWPVIELFTGLLWMHAFDTWKLAGTETHTPRVTVDGLVLLRETWRTTVGGSGLADVTGERDRYLAVRRWRRAMGLPERVFLRIDTEAKPCYVDLSSPLYARILCNLAGAAARTGGPDTGLTVTEVLPGPRDAWLPDAAGRTYSSELRLHLSDPFRP